MSDPTGSPGDARPTPEIDIDVTRRGALRLAAVAGSAVAMGWAGATADADSGPAAGFARSERSFDEGWRFNRGDVSGADAVSFDDGSWRVLDLPHDWGVEDLPYAPAADEGGATSDPSLLVTKVPPAQPVPPPVIGPFDRAGSVGDGSVGYTVGGIGWYRKHFTIPGLGGESPADPHVELRFDGVYQNADVWLNGTHLGFHPYGYTPFAFDLTPYLNGAGDNVLAVRVDNSGKTSRWYSGSGIYRHTWLTVTGAVRVSPWGVYVTTPVVDEHRSVAHVEVSVANLGASATSAHARVTVLDPHGRPVASGRSPITAIAPGATAVAALDIPIERAALWSPHSPSLYTAEVSALVGGAVVDRVTATFGVRSLAWSGTSGFLLNGEKITMVGGCVHDTHGPLGAVAVDRTEERRVEILKAAGFNAIRTAHNPPTPALLDACDRLGMLVMDEFVDMWDTGKNPQDYSVYFAAWWQRDLTSMILRDRNHASVVIWSLGNEIVEDTMYAQRGGQLAALVRSLDRTRPITLGGGSTFGAADASWQYVDIGDVHYNANGHTYGPIHALHPDRPMSQSESFPVTIYQDAKFAADNDWVVGNWVWAAWDYLGEAGIGKTPIPPAGTGATFGDQDVMPGWSTAGALHHSWGGFGYPYPYFQANCGDLDLIGQRKPQNYWRATVTGGSPVEVLVARPAPPGLEQVAVWWGYYDEQPSWTWDAADGQPMTVHVYTPGDSVTVLLNGSEVATSTLTAQDRGLASFTVPYAAGELTAIASRNGRRIGAKTLVTTGPPAALRLTSDVPRLATGRDALAHVLVEVVDAHGRVAPNAAVEVMFTVAGAGELTGVASGNPHNVDSFRRPRRYTWHGLALAILRPAKRPGALTIAAHVSGFRPATLTLPVTHSLEPPAVSR